MPDFLRQVSIRLFKDERMALRGSVAEQCRGIIGTITGGLMVG